MARVAQTGLTLPLDEAKASLLDHKGNLLEFKQQEDGTFKSIIIDGDIDKEGNALYQYTYELNPQVTLVMVSVNKESKEEAKKKAAAVKPRPATAKEEKEAEQYNKSVYTKHK
jgi:hypothetical protein